MRKNYLLILSTLVFLSVCFSSCEAIGNIFKAGVWTGLLIVVVVIGVIIWIVSATRKK